MPAKGKVASAARFHSETFRPCTANLTSTCCGDNVCDGPETLENCPADCSSDNQTDNGGSTGGGGGVRTCSETITSMCCGDGLCDGPETADNCPSDCSDADGDVEDPGEPDPDNTTNHEEPECHLVPEEKPTEPTLCTAKNQGCCECGEKTIKTFVFWPGDGTTQRCFHTLNFPDATPSHPLSVVLHMDGYSGGKKGSEFKGEMYQAAEYYGFMLVKIGNMLTDGAGGFGLEFGNHGIANDANPTPCSDDDSREMGYLKGVFKWIADNPSKFNAGKVYTEGFSQNSMFAIYTGVCFADKVAGTWQGGSGQSRTGANPVAPGYQGQCSFPSFAEYGSDCCTIDFCKDCQYWPLWPKTCNNKIVDCIASYTDDTIACGSDWYMYEAMVQEGNDARLLSFGVPEGDTFAGHKDPHNKWAWFAGCLGLTEACSSDCAASFTACVGSATDEKHYDKFATCEAKLKDGELNHCTVGCSPTLDMLQMSETPVVTLSEGKFGTQTNLGKATGSAPKPDCKVDFGPFSTASGKPKCVAPSDWTQSAINPSDTCSK